MSNPTKMDPFWLVCVLRIMLNNTKRQGYEIKSIELNPQENIEFTVSFPNGEERTVELKLVAD